MLSKEDEEVLGDMLQDAETFCLQMISHTLSKNELTTNLDKIFIEAQLEKVDKYKKLVSKIKEDEVRPGGYVQKNPDNSKWKFTDEKLEREEKNFGIRD